MRFSCPYLVGEVELTKEREKHIGDRHPEFLRRILDRIRVASAEPHEVPRSARFGPYLAASTCVKLYS